MITILDNPVWVALSSRQNHFNEGNDILKYFPADVSPFVGMAHWNEFDLQELTYHLPADRSFSAMIAKEITLPDTLEILFSIPLYQLYCPVLKPIINNDIIIRELGRKDIPQMLSLTELTKPGPFYEQTILFGDYIGIFNADELVAMAGERLKVAGYTEVSAICTSPDFLGRGYASILTSSICERIIANGDIPFLHVRQDNTRAIEVYKKLGFKIRANVFFAVFKKK